MQKKLKLVNALNSPDVFLSSYRITLMSSVLFITTSSLDASTLKNILLKKKPSLVF